ncbi:MAG: DUF4388 domain-containing protein [Deltaproteobacteria bacterium]|nr:DUF4388 domain-containing protein [Deltaproteobacteria bacterium]
MNDPKDRISINKDGSIRVAGEVTRHRLGQLAGNYRIVAGPPGVVILRRHEEGLADDSVRVLMSGEIIGKTTILDVINMIGNANWRGELHILGHDSYRALSFDKGVLKSASSNVSNERLGEILVSRGVLTEEQLADCVLMVNSERKFGEITVEKGYLDRKQLFDGLRAQTEQIFNGALLEHEGTYLFLVRSVDASPPVTTFHLPVTALLMEGVQRIDEMALFRERIASGDMCPVVTDAGSKSPLVAELLPVSGSIDGNRSILEITRELGWDEYQATKTIYQLLKKGYLEVRAAQGVDRDAVIGLVVQFNEVLREIFSVVQKHGGLKDTRNTLTIWTHSSGYAEYFGDEVEPDGSIDPQRVAKAIQHIKIERPLETLHQALHELVSFAMFAAAPTLPRQAELALAKQVNQRIESIRL